MERRRDEGKVMLEGEEMSFEGRDGRRGGRGVRQRVETRKKTRLIYLLFNRIIHNS